MTNFKTAFISFSGTKIGAILFLILFYAILIPIMILKLILCNFIEAITKSYNEIAKIFKDIVTEKIGIKYVMDMSFEMLHPEIAQAEMDERVLNFKYSKVGDDTK